MQESNKIDITPDRLHFSLIQMNQAPLYQVDAFTGVPFKGNPAAVCLMPCDLEDDLYQSIAKEMNLSETAFVEETSFRGIYNLRWFTPAREVPLCGHATLASAYVLFEHAGFDGERITFHTLSGALYAESTPEGIRLDFPRNDPFEVEHPEEVLEALGVSDPEDVQYSDTNQKLLVLLGSPEEVRDCSPDFDALLAAENPLGWRGVIVTAEGPSPYDFVSRYFAPLMGIDEDPVTGSAHTVLTPYWAGRLGKDVMEAYQSSERGGELHVKLTDERVHITGRATTVVVGILYY